MNESTPAQLATWNSFYEEHGHTAAIGIAGAILSLCWMEFVGVTSSEVYSVQLALILIVVACVAVLFSRNAHHV